MSSPEPTRPAPSRRASARPRARKDCRSNSTSLIGVIDAQSGREALLRMPSGDFLKVAAGDTVRGWRVSLIGRDAVRLTRGGESRTLLLVTR